MPLFKHVFVYLLMYVSIYFLIVFFFLRKKKQRSVYLLLRKCVPNLNMSYTGTISVQGWLHFSFLAQISSSREDGWIL